MPVFLAATLWQWLQQWDQYLFLFVNHRLANPVFDAVLPFLRTPLFWAPLYVFILAFALLNWGAKGVWWCLAFLCTVAITDLAGQHLFKETFQRLRPCNDPLLSGEVRLLAQACGSGYSFVSNHAANHFGLATFMVCSLRRIFGSWVYAAYLWAAAVSFAQVYVGVHYPLDVAGGALLGVGAGYSTAALFRRFVETETPLT